jgi:hypothetical protein
MARRLGDTNRPRDDRVEDEQAEVFPHLGFDVGRERVRLSTIVSSTPAIASKGFSRV